jgi:hypothetical protein
MRFDYTTLQQHTSRASRYALLALIISLFAFGALLANGNANPQSDRFTMADATTTENDGKGLRAKEGFELVARSSTTVVARKYTKATMSVDARECKCASTNNYTCFYTSDGPTVSCGTGNSSACCKWVSVNK